MNKGKRGGGGADNEKRWDVRGERRSMMRKERDVEMREEARKKISGNGDNYGTWWQEGKEGEEKEKIEKTRWDDEEKGNKGRRNKKILTTGKILLFRKEWKW